MKHFFERELKLGCVLAPFGVPVGIVISYLFLSLIMFDFQAAFALVALSIICTAGISLILWLPLWYGVGYVTILLVRFGLHLVGLDFLGNLFNKKPAADAPAGPPTLTAEQTALVNYIKKARHKGLTDEQISGNLKTNGWSSNAISDAFQLA